MTLPCTGDEHLAKGSRRQREGVHAARKALYGISMPLFGTNDTQRSLHNVAAAVNAGQPFPHGTFSAGPKDRL